MIFSRNRKNKNEYCSKYQDKRRQRKSYTITGITHRKRTTTAFRTKNRTISDIRKKESNYNEFIGESRFIGW